GRGAAEPLGVFPLPGGSFGRRNFRWSMNGDRYPDSTITFRVRDAGIAFGDREVCVVARTHEGELLEGCDRIDAGCWFLNRLSNEEPVKRFTRCGAATCVEWPPLARVAHGVGMRRLAVARKLGMLLGAAWLGASGAGAAAEPAVAKPPQGFEQALARRE